MPTIPYRFREQSFRRYERVIESVVNQYPICFSVNPKDQGYTYLTFSNGLRNAMASLLKYNWQTTINMARFRELYPKKIEVVEGEDGLLIVRDKNTTKQPQTPITPVASRNDWIFNLGDENLIFRLAELKLLTQPILIEKMGKDEASQLEASFDIALEDQGNGIYKLI